MYRAAVTTNTDSTETPRTGTAGPDTAGPGGAFQRDVYESTSLIRDRFSKIIENKCPGCRAVSSLAEAFEIHRKLAWQLGKVAYAEDAFTAARHMPSARGIESWFKAARGKGVPDELLDPAREAWARFDELSGRHAASRAEFEMLLESCSADDDAATEIRWRQQAYLGNGFTWGAQCRTLLALTVLMPSADRERHFHAVQVRGLIGYRQTRPGVRWIVNQSVVTDDNAETRDTLQRVPLDPEAAAVHAGVPVLPAFCSDPMPALERRRTPDGLLHDEFAPGPVGLSGERTLVTGEVIRNIGPVHATDQDRVAHFGSAVRTPAETLHLDLLVAHGLFGEVEREAVVFSDLASSVAFGDEHELRVSAGVVKLGRGLGMSQTPDIPGYAGLCESVCDLAGIDPDGYELFRVRLEYPPVPTTVMVRHPLLEPGEL